MKLRLADIIIIAVVMILSFPIMYIVMLFATGNARVEFSKSIQTKIDDQQKLHIMKHSKYRDSLAVIHLQTYQALQRERNDLEDERKKLVKQQERINILLGELAQKQQELTEQQNKFEQLVAQNDELEMKRIKQLAKVYGAMRANEAARILETLDDNLCIKIINSIGDDRQKAKIMANISQDKASRISKKMGKTVKNDNG